MNTHQHGAGKKNQVIARSKGGLITKTPTRTDALGNPTGFYLTGGCAYDAGCYLSGLLYRLA